LIIWKVQNTCNKELELDPNESNIPSFQQYRKPLYARKFS